MSENRSREVKTAIPIEYQLLSTNTEGFEAEFESLSESDSDPIGHWLRLAKARGETKDSDMLVVNLIVELYRKVDEVASLLKCETTALLELENIAKLTSIGHGVFTLEDGKLSPGEIYYARINMPVFPRRTIALFFRAIENNKGLVERIHERDEKDIDSYIVARERSMIREQRERKWES